MKNQRVFMIRRKNEGSDGTENEIQGCGKGGFVERHAHTFHQQLGCGGVGSHIDTHMTHDAEERQQDDGLAQQTDAIHERRRLTLLYIFLNRSNPQQCRSQDADNEINEEQHAPIVSERRT